MNMTAQRIRLYRIRSYCIYMVLSIFVYGSAVKAQGDEHGRAEPASEAKNANTLVSPFKGSETLAEYAVDFEKLALAESGDIKKIFTVEGRLTSHIYRKPSANSNFQVFRSYERELKAAGFTILSNSTDTQKTFKLVSKLYSKGNNSIANRTYKTVNNFNTRNFVFGEFYLAAKKRIAGKSVYVAIFLNKPTSFKYYDDAYLVDVLENSELEGDNVAVNVKSIQKKIEDDGRFIIYSIYFDTGKAAILPESTATLETMASYLKSNSDRQFYIVGHTDDTGTFGSNLGLSLRRSTSVVRALQNQYGVGSNQIESKGVGPLAPVASNETGEGRKLNRRVELVLKLKN